MNLLFLAFAPLLAVLLLMTPLIPVYKGIKTGKKAKNAIVTHLGLFFGVCLVSAIVPLSAFAATGDATAFNPNAGMAYLSAALSTGLATIGAGISVASAASAAIGACSENTKAFGKSLIFVVLGEGIAIYGLLISIMILIRV